MNRSLVVFFTLIVGGAIADNPPGAPDPARGPLRVHPTNPRYFTDGTKLPDGSLKAVYLTGSHTWANLIDRGPSDPPPAFDFDRYLDLLQKNNHNFIRLWSRHVSWYQKYGDVELRSGPLAWPRTGPGLALDGKPRFDFTRFDTAYFDRLRSRVNAARERGIYVSVMLFGGNQEAVPDWTGNPFHRANNINGIDGDPNQDGSGAETQTLSEIPKPVAEVQKAYVRKVIDTVDGFDNVLFEISNESIESSAEWQYDLIRFIHAYEKKKHRQHPVGMTAGFWTAEENRRRLDSSPAQWVSYLFDPNPPSPQGPFRVEDPFVADGRKVSIMDSDHWWVVQIYGNAQLGRDWVWKSFCRGHHPILMEHLPPRSFVKGDHPLSLDDPGYIASRKAMGHTRRYAERMNLAAAAPSKKIASTGFCLAVPGKEYLVYVPGGGGVTVDLTTVKTEVTVEWFDPVNEKVVAGGNIRGGKGQQFHAPFKSPAVLYLSRR